MKLSKLLGERVKQNSSGATVKSHIYMLRAGYMKQMATGIYTLLTPAKKSVLKIENIIREEMNKVDGQEVLFPVVMPREMWEESNRYNTIGSEMVRFKDRFNHDMLLGMTHEEAAVFTSKNIVKSYEQLPYMIYQIQTKFRDEPRSRAGLIRVREFTMKDAYSFHESQEDLEQYYQRVYDAYNRIFKRIGMKNFIAVAGDSGMMGGKIAHEFMLLTPSGEDSLVLCDKCGYKSNMEVAKGIIEKCDAESQPLAEIDTGDAKTIEEVCDLLKIDTKQTCKAVSYAIKGNSEKSLLVFIRGDLEVNEVKVKSVIKADIAPNELSADDVLVAGNIGPMGLDSDKFIMLYDESLKDVKNLVCGANKKNYHFMGFEVARDIGDVEYFDLSKVKDGDKCPHCDGGKLYINRGIEIGNIFQLGTKYTESMKMTVHSRNGEDFNPIMGCYGIGVGRALASVLEEKSDDKGLVFPMSIAPWHVCLCPLKLEDEKVASVALKLYDEMLAKGIEVLFDDRTGVSAGFKFAESELMGMPIRVVISPRSLENNQAEVMVRETLQTEFVELDKLSDYLKAKISEEIAKLND